MEPGLVGRDLELRRLVSDLRRGRGAVVVGPFGIGKTRLVTEASSQSNLRVLWMAVTREAASIPLGPFSPLVPDLGSGLASGEVTSAFTHVRDAFLAGERSPLMVVDDAHLLDTSSAALVHSLAGNAGIPVVATIRSGESVPDAVTALWKDMGLLRIELGPLSQAETEALSVALLGGAADARTLSELWRISEGHPLELRETIVAAKESGALTASGGTWALTGELNPTSRLIELLEARLRRLDPDERSAAETIAYGEPLDMGLLVQVVGSEVLERLERSGTVRVIKDGVSVPTVSLSHPLYGEVLRGTLPESGRRSVALRLAEAADDSEASIDPLRLAIWRLDAGAADAEELAGAAISAVGRMAWDVALRMGAASVALEGSHMAHSCMAAALAELGDPEGAEAQLRLARDFVDDPLRLAWNSISLGDVWFYHAGRMEEALELLRKEIALAVDPTALDDLMSSLAINLMMYGDLEEVSSLTSEALEGSGPSSVARLMALIASSSSDGLLLRPGEARAGVEAALPLVAENLHKFANAEDVLYSALTVAAIAAGDPVTARAIVDERRRDALETDRGDGPGFWGMHHGLVLLYEGQALSSHRALVEALLLLERFDSWLSGPLARVGAAHAAAVMGRVSDAEAHIESVAPDMRKTPRIRSRLGHVQALLTAAGSGLSAGSTEAVQAGDQAAADHHLLWAAEAWHLAVRLGKPEAVVDRLSELADDRPDTVASLFRSHAEALAEQDIAGLGEVARSFDRCGFKMFAAETACQLSGIHQRRNEARLARRAATMAHEYLPAGSGANTPPFSNLVGATPLTEREREVSLLASSGMTSREIAEKLFISVRSVDNHLARVYTKLAVKGRGELSLLLSPDAGEDQA